MQMLQERTASPEICNHVEEKGNGETSNEPLSHNVVRPR